MGVVSALYSKSKHYAQLYVMQCTVCGVVEYWTWMSIYGEL